MFLHLGKDVVIPIKEVVAVIDINTAKTSKATKEFLQIAQEEGFINDISDGNPKSFIISNQKIYLSAISSVTLQRRAGFIQKLS
ncbi:MAG: extracellular matrix regulatory protein [Thermosediminibacterales bacterium]|nr:extracellular matrix regulatory protein [Thermosediminibacterales bacterium]MDK2835709.1 extracellular matrix regulatory protein [Thermosediminibacterales bacterium]